MNTILTDDERNRIIDSMGWSLDAQERGDMHRLIQAVLAKLAQQEPVAWMRPSGKAMLETGGCCTVYASDGMSNYSAPLYTHPAPHQAYRQRVPQSVIAYMAVDRDGEVGFTDRQNVARELEERGWAITPLAAAPEAPAQASAVDERAAFEAWAMEFNPQLLIEFNGPTVHGQIAWSAWQARAALAQKGGDA